ncbi:MAG TPA: hypothetical protein VM867_08050 [Xanthobacteraceae bacterium]|nr:hypothetical protein [Xanthobacteraceae bacterium]
MLRDKPVVKFVAKVATQSATAVLATLIGGYVLTLLNLRTPAESARAPEPTVSDERALTREYVKSLREGGREAAAEVRPTAPAESVIAKGVVPVPADAPAVLPVARKENRIRTETSAASTQVPALGTPIELAPAKVADVDTSNDPRAVAPHRGESTVFSVISGAIGSAANATGESINFMIDLPGRVLRGGRDARSEVAPQAKPQPAGQPRGADQPGMRFAGS